MTISYLRRITIHEKSKTIFILDFRRITIVIPISYFRRKTIPRYSHLNDPKSKTFVVFRTNHENKNNRIRWDYYTIDNEPSWFKLERKN